MEKQEWYRRVPESGRVVGIGRDPAVYTRIRI